VTPVFVDTSALYALLVRSDARHDAARRAFHGLMDREAPLLTTSYVLVETYALLGRRVGAGAVRAFRAEFEPLLDVVWVDRPLHEAGLDLLAASGDRALSLVDAVSFRAMRDRRLDEALAYDHHFRAEGFILVD
jgi:uncharacterized protein